MGQMTNEELYLAETVTDYLYEQAELTKDEIQTLLKFRNDMICKRSQNQEYQCAIKVPFADWCCDICLEAELYKLWSIGIITVGSCCGHGGKYMPYIQVLSDDHVQIIHKLGYTQIPPDEYGNGQKCFLPQTKLIIPTDEQRKAVKWSE